MNDKAKKSEGVKDEKNKDKIRNKREKKVKREKRIRSVKNVIRGATSFLQKEKRIIDKNTIKSILPHRGTMLLLDKVVITAKKIIGEFQVTEEVCEGHAVWNGELLMKGSDFLDMAAQLLGIWAAQLPDPDFKNKRTIIREYGGAKFRNPTRPGEFLIMELDTENTSAEVLRDGRLIIINGSGFLAKVGEERKVDVYSVELIIA